MLSRLFDALGLFLLVVVVLLVSLCVTRDSEAAVSRQRQRVTVRQDFRGPRDRVVVRQDFRAPIRDRIVVRQPLLQIGLPYAAGLYAPARIAVQPEQLIVRERLQLVQAANSYSGTVPYVGAANLQLSRQQYVQDSCLPAAQNVEYIQEQPAQLQRIVGGGYYTMPQRVRDGCR